MRRNSASSHSEHGLAEIHNPTKNGYLYVLGFFSRWRKLYVDLQNHVIYIRVMRGGIAKRTFKLHANTLCEENSTRPFCFSLSTPGSKETLFLAAENVAFKETWIDAIQSSLYLLRLADRKLRDKDKKKIHAEAVKQYITRPKIYIKIISARDLQPKDANGYSDPYVKVTLGSSTVRTTTRKRNLNPDWGMVFPFDWDMTMRYAIVEVWDEDFTSADDFLGTVFIPVFSFYDGYNSKRWYPLCKRSAKSTVSGEIEIEISCSGQPDGDLLAWQFFYEVQKLPEFSMDLVALEDGNGQIGLKNAFVRGDFGESTANTARNSLTDSARPSLESLTQMHASVDPVQLLEERPSGSELGKEANKEASDLTLYGFPFNFPAIENETLEDISFSCDIIVTINNQKIEMDGVLLLTSYRLIFLTHKRILLEKNSPSSVSSNVPTTPLPVNPLVSASGKDVPIQQIHTSANDLATDLSFQIPITMITTVNLASENDPLDQTIAYDTLRIKTADCRQYCFLFKDESVISSNFQNPHSILHKAIDQFFRGDKTAEMVLKRRPTNTGTNNEEGSSKSTEGKSPTTLTASNRRKLSILQSYGNPTGGNSVGMTTVNYGNFSQLEVCWLNIIRGNQIFNIEASESAEGPPSHRITQRLRVRTVNRGIERYRLLTEYYELINNIRVACNLEGYSPPSMYDLDIKLSEGKFLTDPNGIVINGIFRYTNEITEADRLSSAKQNSEATFNNPSASASMQITPNLSEAVNSTHLPLGWTNATSAIEEPVSEGNAKRKKSLLSDLIKRIRKSEALQNSFTKLLFNFDNSWRLFNPLIEYRRQGIPNDRWRITHVNDYYELTETYPSVLVVPAAVDDETIRKAAEFRSRKRFPTLSWLHPKNGCSISRSSQPYAGITNNRNECDEKLIYEMNKCNRLTHQYHPQLPFPHPNPSIGTVSTDSNTFSMKSPSLNSTTNNYGSDVSPYIIIDARPAINAKANQALGKGVENEKNYENASVLFMDIPNIHAVRKSIEVLEDSLYDENKSANGIELSQWLVYLYRILIASARIAHCVHYENISILVHCSDGWDRTSQLTSLSMLLLDDYYRSLDGFIVLIEKEWISFGHKFNDRLGWTQDGWKDEERSPIFFQFLDCVHQILIQLPDAFEFNDDLLLFIAEQHNSGYFGNFFFNTEWEMLESAPHQYSISIWSIILANRSQFINSSYQPITGLITPVISRSKIVLWSEYFLKWHDRLWLHHWTSEYNDTEIKKKTEIVWTEDRAAIECMRCTTKFSLFRRRHHCRCCGQIFCDPCSKEVRIIPAISRWRALRCCEECASAIDLTQAEINEARRSTLGRSAGREAKSREFLTSPLHNQSNNNGSRHNSYGGSMNGSNNQAAASAAVSAVNNPK